MSRLLRIGTRDSALALWQANRLKNELLVLGMASELVPIKSQGDHDQNQPLYAMGITGIFTKALDIALLDNRIDIAIHSMKDVPTQLPKGIVQAAVLPRGKTGDVVVWKTATAQNKSHRTIATGSLRRKAQWLHHYPNDTIVPLRGNIHTRLQKLNDNDWDGAIFAEAALERLDVSSIHVQKVTEMIPAPAQGALLVVCRLSDEDIAQQLTLLNDREAELCTQIERDFLHALEGGCTAPIGALANCHDQTISFSGGLYSLQGNSPQLIEASFSMNEAPQQGRKLAKELLANGGAIVMNEFKRSHE